MNILFINIQLRKDSIRRQLPVGLAYVMTAANKAGFDFDLIDMDIDNISMRSLKSRLQKKLYDIYAFGCIATGYKQVKGIAKTIREIHPLAKIIAGNSVASSMSDLLLETTEVDYAVVGEADGTIVDLLRSLLFGSSKIEQVKGIVIGNHKEGVPCRYKTLKRKPIDNLDSIGFPKWDLFDLKKYRRYSKKNVNSFAKDEITSFPLNSARGCPYNCSFCYHVFKGQKYRRYSITAVVDEIKRLHSVYGCNYIAFWDELTFPNDLSAKNFIEEMEKLPFKIKWAATTRSGIFNSKSLSLLKRMKTVGCESISFSLENADKRILNQMNKSITVKGFKAQANVLHKAGIVPLTSIIFGYPSESKETIKKTIEVCRQCNIYPSTGFLLPLPGTIIYDWAKKYSYIDDEVEYLERIGDRQDFHINLTNMYSVEFVDIVREELTKLADEQGVKVDNVFKTGTYKKPKDK